MREISTGDIMHVYGGFGEGVSYTARISTKLNDEVDADILQRSIQKAQLRYPYFSVRLRKNDTSYYYEENPLPVVLIHTGEKCCLNSPLTNYHAWAVCCEGAWIHHDFFHEITDGTGMYNVLATLLYYYCDERYGASYQNGIHLAGEEIPPEELRDPQDDLEKPQTDLEKPQTEKYPPVSFQKAFTPETDGGMTPDSPTIWDVEIPEDAFIRFTSANDASPGTMVSLLFARAIDELYPDRKKTVINAYVINARSMLHAEKTFHTDGGDRGSKRKNLSFHTAKIQRGCYKKWISCAAGEIWDPVSAEKGHGK